MTAQPAYAVRHTPPPLLRPMRDKTVTETHYDFPSAADRPRVPGVVVVYSREASTMVGWRVERAFTVGRDRAAAEVAVDDPGVSRCHLTLEPGSGGVLVSDQGSHNGTFVAGARVSAPRVHAAYGSVIRMGKTLLYVTDDVVPFETRQSDLHAELVGGPSLADVRLRIETLAASADPVLVEGETGTGKEVVAQLLHERSGRTGKIVGLNCAAIAPDLVESELFGHSKGAFSGSSSSRAGLFRSAHGGTLLLDEIGELPPALQAKLLRVIETGEVRGVGEDVPARVDVRIVAATNKNLDAMVAGGEFRGDLLHRIAATRVRLPSLDARREDLPVLAEHFLSGSGVGLGAAAAEALFARSWPGNVRELRNTVRVAATAAKRAGRDRLLPDDLSTAEPVASGADGDESLRSRLVAALAAADGNVTRAAREVGMARSGLYESLKRLRLNPASFRRR